MRERALTVFECLLCARPYATPLMHNTEFLPSCRVTVSLFAYAKTKAQRGSAACLRPHSQLSYPSWYSLPPVSDSKPHYFLSLTLQPCQVLPLLRCTWEVRVLQQMNRLWFGGVRLVPVPPASLIPIHPVLEPHEAVSMTTPHLPVRGHGSKFKDLCLPCCVQ